MPVPAPGPKPPGVPAAMRALAQTLRGFAAPLGGLSTVDLSNWESPRGRAVKADIQQGADTAGQVAGDLRSLAADLVREADRLEDDQLDWSRHYSAYVNQSNHMPGGKI